MKKIKIFAVCFLFILCFCVNSAENAKYVFLLIGDGMGPTIRQYYFHEFPDSSLEKFPIAVMTNTDNYQKKTTDSAASGTAIACGVKTYNGALGVNPDRKPVVSLAKLLRDRKFSVGVITSVGLNDATPGAHYANRYNRRDAAGSLSDLAVSGFDFFAGGKLLLPPDYKIKTLEHLLNKCKYELITNLDFSKVPANKRMVMVGDMSPAWPSRPHPRHVLAETTAFAAERLAKNPKGFFLVVEGGSIDHGGHSNDLACTMREMREFDMAVRAAWDFYKKHPKETLIVVTTDHDTGGLNLNKEIKNSFWQKQPTSATAVEKEFVKLMKKSSDDELLKYLTEKFALENLTADEEKVLREAIKVCRDPELSKKVDYRSMYGRYNPAVVAARRIRDARHGLSWTHFSHTSRQVVTNALGAGSEYIKSVKENTDIPRAISKAVCGKDLIAENNNAEPIPPADNLEEYFNFVSAAPDKVVFRYGQKLAEPLKITFDGKTVVRNDRAGRIEFDKLSPNKVYTLTVERSGKEIAKRQVETPAAGKGELLGRFAVIADSHLSLSTDARYGRLHSKSVEVFQDALKALDGKVDFIAMPGDVTDASRPLEMQAVASALKAYSKQRFLAVPGNHDLMNRKDFSKFWQQTFGKARVEKYGDWQILLLDTWNGNLTDKEENIQAINALDPAKPVIVFSHFQLIADKMVGMKDSSIHDFDKAAGLLEKLAKMRGMILVGHKNVATRAELGNLVQLNMPQLTQFPAGYIVAELFTDGIRLEFKSAFDLFYDEYSRLRGAAFGQGAERRDKYSLSIWNKFYPVSK